MGSNGRVLLVFNYPINTNKFEIYTTNFSNGLYIVEISGKDIIRKKIIVQHLKLIK